MKKVSPSLFKKEIIKQTLLSDITRGKYAPGQKLMGEARFASQLGVAKETLRRVLDELADEGVLIRKRGSGTYIREKATNAVDVNIPIAYTNKLLVKLFWGKLLEHANRRPDTIRLHQVFHPPVQAHPDVQKVVARLFTSPESVGLYEITMNDLDWLAQAGFCQDLTARFQNWSQKDNFYPIAVETVTYKNRIYALPFHCTLSGVGYNRKAFDRLDLSVQETMGSLEGFMRTLEKLSKNTNFRYSFWSGPLRSFLMSMLRAFYGNLFDHFISEKPASPIDREIGQEVLQRIHDLKWKFRADIGGLVVDQQVFTQMRTDIIQARIPMFMGALEPTASLDHAGKAVEVDFTLFGFGRDRDTFSFYNSFVWIINPHTSPEIQEFLWSFLQNFVSPETEYELDRRHLEIDEVNHRTVPFIKSLPRIPDDGRYEANRRTFFQHAERELPYPCPAFDNFVLAVQRMLIDRDADARKEYDFYRTIFAADSSDPAVAGFGAGRLH